MGSDQFASEYLNSLGIPGLQYLDQQSRGKGDGTHNFVVWDEGAMEVMEKYYQDRAGKKGARGAIDFTDPNRITITLTPRSDVTTSIHEMGHLFRWIMERQAARFTDDAQLQADWETVREFGDHEKFANAAIEYAMEGKVPEHSSPALVRAFRQFKQWLVEFYNAVRGNPRVKLTDEMRGVFDRLIAGDASFGTDYGLDAFTGEDVFYQGPAEIRRKERDTSKDTKFLDMFNSPNVVAERHAPFRPFFSMTKDAYARQERLRSGYSRAADKIFGKPGLFGRRKGGLVTKAQRETFFDILIEGDAAERVFSDAELAERGASDDTIKAYRMTRKMYDSLYSMINTQRKKYGKDEMAYREGYVPHFFHSWRVMKGGEILSSYRSLREAVKAAGGMGETGLVIAPFVDDFGGQARIDAVTLGDMQYFKLVGKVKDVFALTLDEARDFVSGDIAKMQNRSRMFKNAAHRKGVKGWDANMEYALRHYAN
jgi:hypothetical protein